MLCKGLVGLGLGCSLYLFPVVMVLMHVKGSIEAIVLLLQHVITLTECSGEGSHIRHADS